MMAKMMLLMPLSKYPYEDNDGGGGEDDEEHVNQDVKDDVTLVMPDENDDEDEDHEDHVVACSIVHAPHNKMFC